ncbi:MAG: DUF6788 family protein [Acidimicrobiales bacterium]
MPRARLSEHERRLEALRAEYEAAKARLAEVGFTCEGSLVERYTSCHNPRCRCADPTRRHGPYWQLSWKQDGRTVSRIISVEEAVLYQQWIANRRRLEDILAEMRDISRQAGEQATNAVGHPFVGPSRPRRRRRSDR